MLASANPALGMLTMGSVALFTSSNSSAMGQKRRGQELGLVEETREGLKANEFPAAPRDARAVGGSRGGRFLVDSAVEALDVEVAAVVAAGQVVERLVRPVVVVDVLDDLPAAEDPHPAEEHVRSAQGAELIVTVGVVVDELEAELDCAGVQVVVARQDHLDQLDPRVRAVSVGARGVDGDASPIHHVGRPGREQVG